jgi:hypothetical protein
LTLVGLAVVGVIHFLGVKGSLATMIGAFATFALLFGQGFRWNRGPIFRLLRSIDKTGGNT